MRQRLTLAIEVISLVSGVGVVASILIYAYVFGRYRLSYLAIASLADMLRDALQLLIFALLGLAVVAFMYAIANYGVRPAALAKAQGTLKFANRALKYTLPIALWIFLSIHISSVITNPEPKALFAPMVIFNVVCLSGMAYSFLFDAFKNAIEMTTPVVGMKHLPAVSIAIFTVVVASLQVNEQLANGIRADVYPLDRTLCRGGKYTVVWLGENRMIARCEKVHMMVVKTLN